MRVASVEDRKTNAVETSQSVLRSQPQITIPGLQDRTHGIVGQSVLGLPDIMTVLSYGLRGVEGKGGGPPRPPGDDAKTQEAAGQDSAKTILDQMTVS